jgi:probable addiction module antidote protein
MRPLTTYPWDTAEFLTTEESIAAYLQLAIEDSADDPASLLEALGAVARARSMTALAREAGITREGLYKALSSTGNPSVTTVVRLTRALGLTLSVRVADTAPAPRAARATTRKDRRTKAAETHVPRTIRKRRTPEA